jgi:hypothetical protein
MRTRSLVATVATAGVAGAVVVGIATPAAAAPRDGICDPTNTYGYGFGEACFYWLTNRTGSMADFSAENPSNPDLYVKDPTLADDRFTTPDLPHRIVNNNTRSVCNTDWYPLLMYRDANFQGSALRLNSGNCFLDLGTWKDDIESYRWTFG